MDGVDNGAPASSRTYLVVVDKTDESRVALRWAALRAEHVGARLLVLNVLPMPEFMQWGGVQEAIEAEAEATAQALLESVADDVAALTGARPGTLIGRGKPTQAVLDAIDDDPSIHALVLAAAAKGAPGPLVSFFAGEKAGALPCLVMIVPGGLSEARLSTVS